MPVPSAQEIRKPLLEIFKDEAPHNFVINELVEIIAGKLDVELDELSSTEKTAFKNNINDATNYLRKKKLLSNPSKTTYMLTRAGSEVLDDNPEIIDDDYLNKSKASESIEEASIIQETETSQESSAPEADTKEQEEQEVDSASEIPLGFDEQENQESQEEDQQEQQEEEIFEDAEQAPKETEPQEETLNNIEELEEVPAPADETEEAEEEAEADDFSFGDTSEEEENIIENENEENENENEDLAMNTPEPELTPELQEQTLDEPEAEIEKKDFSNSNLDIEDFIAQYNDKLASDLLERIEALHQDNFCVLVMDLLSKMGYRAFQTARYTNEAEGSDLIQGIILENKAGMNPIYIHVRKSSSSKTISKADMLDFVNALSDKGGKGMFVTVGNFSKSAEEIANDEGIMLVDGKKFASLLISNNFCVNTEKIFELKAIDSESFSEYED